MLAQAEVVRIRQLVADVIAAIETWGPARTLGPQTQLDIATLYECAERAGVPGANGLAEPRIELAVERFVETPPTMKLIGGRCGVGWLLTHLLDQEVADEACAQIDRSVRDHVDLARWRGDFGLLRGLAGIGVYGLARRHTAAGQRILERVVDHLEASAERSPAGLAWRTPGELTADRDMFPRGHYDYGLAHGIPGVIGVLARLIDAGIEATRCERMLEGAVAFLLDTVPPRSPARFPAWRVPDAVDAAPARLAWCYGDAGVALALLAAARACDRADWSREAIEIASRASSRSRSEAGAVDAGICHGAAGLAHAFHRLHLATGDAVFREAARSWIAATLSLRVDSEGLAGYRTLRMVDGTSRWEADAALLTGATGVALVLLAAACEAGSDWDAMLLFDVAARRRPRRAHCSSVARG